MGREGTVWCGWLREPEERRKASARRMDGRKSEGRGEWLVSLSLSLSLSPPLFLSLHLTLSRGGTLLVSRRR